MIYFTWDSSEESLSSTSSFSITGTGSLDIENSIKPRAKKRKSKVGCQQPKVTIHIN